MRVLQEKFIEKVGGITSIPIDVRVIAATNRDLEGLVVSGSFRKDIFYRLNVIPLHIPPLRSRKRDIVILAELFLKKYSKKFGKDIQGINRNAKVYLLSYNWPGNVRELENAIEYAVNIELGKFINETSLHIIGQNFCSQVSQY
ncbi:MAG: sigma 54-interacting transcriptional regulator [Bacillota bacterium]